MGKISLFDIGQEFKALYSIATDVEVDEETNEVIDNTDTLKKLFDEVEGTLIDKLDNTQYVIKELQSDSTMLADEIKRLQAKKKALENRAIRLKTIMQDTILTSGSTKLKGKFSFSLSNRKSLELEPHITPEFFNSSYVRVKKEFDKTKITKDLKSGIVIDGATLVDKVSLTVR